MKSKNKLLNEITKRVKIKLLQEANTPPEIDDILDRLNMAGGDTSKLSKADKSMLDYYSEHGRLPEKTSMSDKEILMSRIMGVLTEFDQDGVRNKVDFALISRIIRSVIGSGIKMSDMETGFIMDVINEWADDSITTEECAEHIVEFVFGLLEGDEEGAY